MSKILVTGGAGFIGSALSKKLVKQGHDVTSYDLKPNSICNSIVANILDFNKIRGAIKNADYVFHLASVADVNYARTHPEETFEVNICGTHTVAECCSRLQVPLSYISTVCVYGNTPEHPTDEESVCLPTEIYGATKYIGEKIVEKIVCSRPFKYNILRFGTVYGPGMRRALAVYIWLNQALRNKPLTIHGSGSQTRCVFYINDLTEFCFRVFKNQITGEILNLAGEEELSVLEMVNVVLQATGKPKKLVFVEDRPGQIFREQINILKAKKLLGYAPKTKFRDGLSETLEWVKETQNESVVSC